MAQIQGAKPEPAHKVGSGGNPASAKGQVDGGDVGSGIDSSGVGGESQPPPQFQESETARQERAQGGQPNASCSKDPIVSSGT